MTTRIFSNDEAIHDKRTRAVGLGWLGFALGLTARIAIGVTR